jgi:hypothetical protein
VGGDRLSPGGLDLGDDRVGALGVDVVDDDPGAARGEFERVRAPVTTATTPSK